MATLLIVYDKYIAFIIILKLISIINNVTIIFFKVPGQSEKSISVEDIYRSDQILIISRKIAILCLKSPSLGVPKLRKMNVINSGP